MSGHNKWSKIKHKKASEDNKKSKEFSRLAQLITVEAKNAGGNKDAPGLRKAVERARAVNMPSANIERAVAKGFGGVDGSLDEVVYEAYGPGGVAIIIHGFTDNKNRSSAEVKSTLTKHGLALAEQGAASWAFEKTIDGWVPHTTMDISSDEREKLKNLIDALLENDSVEAVYSNVS